MSISWKHVPIIVAALVIIGMMCWFLPDANGVEANHLWFYAVKTGGIFVGDGKDVPLSRRSPTKRGELPGYSRVFLKSTEMTPGANPSCRPTGPRPP